MPKKAGIVFLSLGAVLIVSALLLFLHNDREDDKAGQDADMLLQGVQSIIAERIEAGTRPAQTAAPKQTDTPKLTAAPQLTPSMTEPPQLTVVEIDGYGYVGYLSIPDLELELPVMSEWDYERLKLAPCRHFGQTATDDLVIAAHNYQRHFGRLSELGLGATVIFTDMDGEENVYAVTKFETLDPKAVDVVHDSGYDLVLYTCTYGGANRVAVFCNRVE